MSGVSQVTQAGPKSFTPDTSVTTSAPILGGKVVELNDSGRLVLGAANSARCVGAALTDGIAPENVNTAAVTNGMGRPVLAAVPIPTHVSVAYSGAEVYLFSTAAVKPGQKVKSAGSGNVTLHVTGTDPGDIAVGICTDPNGIAANAVGLVRML